MKRLKRIFSLIFVCIGFSSCIDILDPLNILHDDTEYPEDNGSGQEEEMEEYSYFRISDVSVSDTNYTFYSNHTSHEFYAHKKFDDYVCFKLSNSVLKYEYNTRKFMPLENKYDFKFEQAEYSWLKGEDQSITIHENIWADYTKGGLYKVTSTFKGIKKSGEADVLKQQEFYFSCILDENR